MWIHISRWIHVIMWIHTLHEIILFMWIHRLYEFTLCWCDFLFQGAITSLCFWSGEGGKNGIALVRAMVMSVIIVLGVQKPVLGGCAWLTTILFNMMVVIAPAAWSRARARPRAQRWSGMRLEQYHISICICDSQTQICDLWFVTFAFGLHILGHKKCNVSQNDHIIRHNSWLTNEATLAVVLAPT